MFIIFGFGKKTVKEMGSTGTVQCGHCSNVREWQYKKVTTWFTLFFIPLIPYKMTYIKECPICHMAYQVDKEEVLGEEVGGSSHNSDHSSDAHLTEVQRNYREQMASLKNENSQ